MKKKAPKLKEAVGAKKLKKELELKLKTAFSQTILDYGKRGKTTSIIEKFAKKLAKKVDLKAEIPVPAVEDSKHVSTTPKKTTKAKPKTAKK